MIVAFVRDKALNGDITEDPFNLKHYNINYIVPVMDGASIILAKIRLIHISIQIITIKNN
jgi:hypothetical protein